MATMNGKSAIVTGVSRGIGRGIALAFAAAGANVTGAARGQAGLEEVTPEFRAEQFEPVVADVAEPADVERIVAAATKRFGGVDVLCHNAAIFPETRLDELEQDEWNEVIATNLTSTFTIVKACLSQLRESGKGRIVLISSITGSRVGYPGLSHYGASKAGMSGFMRGAALELAADGITINAIEPGSIRTTGLATLGEEAIAAMEALIPVGSLGEPEDVAAAAVFLASEEARFVTGQTLVVDGGQTLPELPL